MSSRFRYLSSQAVRQAQMKQFKFERGASVVGGLVCAAAAVYIPCAINKEVLALAEGRKRRYDELLEQSKRHYNDLLAEIKEDRKVYGARFSGLKAEFDKTGIIKSSSWPPVTFEQH